MVNIWRRHNPNKQNAIDNLLRLNIQPCKTSVDITTLLESCMNEHEKESVVKAQITYFKWVMSPPNIDHKLFFFSKERKKLSCETLIQNLLNFGYGQTSEKQTYVHLVCVAQAASVAPLEYL
jgi:hypothetical protein